MIHTFNAIWFVVTFPTVVICGRRWWRAERDYLRQSPALHDVAAQEEASS